jgi:Glycosyl transferase family 2
MTLLARDEEDILAANLDFHLAQGVDFFIVTDNLSVDGTRGIIERYVRRGLALYLHEPADDFAQFRWVTRMARLASIRYGADWVINSDADEFWLPEAGSGTIKEALAALPRGIEALKVPRTNFIPAGELCAGFFAERMRLRERQSYNSLGDPLPPKVCHLGFDDVEVDQGNHHVAHGGVHLPPVPGPLRILHYPVRSYRQFENKIIHGGAAYARNRELSPNVGKTWRRLYEIWQEGGLREWYSQQLLSDAEIDDRLRRGDLLYDDSVLEVLRHRTLKPV